MKRASFISPRGKLYVVLTLFLLVAILGYASRQSSIRAPELNRIATGDLPVLVELGSSTCGPCRMMVPILADIEREYRGRLVVQIVDIYKQRDVALEYLRHSTLRVIPTLILYDVAGNEVWRHEGFIDKESLKAVMAKKLGL